MARWVNLEQRQTWPSEQKLADEDKGREQPGAFKELEHVKISGEIATNGSRQRGDVQDHPSMIKARSGTKPSSTSGWQPKRSPCSSARRKRRGHH